MTKKRHPEPEMQKSVSLSDDKHLIQAIYLTIGPWRKLFADEQNKLIIAEALNYCVGNEGMIIIGYLVTSRQVYLVLKINKTAVEGALALFYSKVRTIIKQYLEQAKGLEFNIYGGDEQAITGYMFKRYPLVNYRLIGLITGEKVSLPYYDPALARLKDRIHNNKFCSAIDYSGARGPVYLHGKYIENCDEKVVKI